MPGDEVQKATEKAQTSPLIKSDVVCVQTMGRHAMDIV
jgi:hypothetical protein